MKSRGMGMWPPLLMGFLFISQALLSVRLSAWVHPEPVEAFQAMRMDKRVASTLRAVAFISGYRVLVGHAFWIKVIQYYGDAENAADHFSKLYDYCSLASDLNPKFISTYTFGASALAFHLHRIDEAVRLLKKGINSNPGDIRLKLMLAAIAYQNAGEWEKVIPFLEAQIARGDAPVMLVEILANTYQKVGRYQDAVHLWQKMLRETDQPEMRIKAGLKLQVLYGILKSGQNESAPKLGPKEAK